MNANKDIAALVVLLGGPDQAAALAPMLPILLSVDTWDRVLSPAERQRLLGLMPPMLTASSGTVQSRQQLQLQQQSSTKIGEANAATRFALERLLSGDNLFFGTPVGTLQSILINKQYGTDWAYENKRRQEQYEMERNYYLSTRKYKADFIMEALVFRKQLFGPQQHEQDCTEVKSKFRAVKRSRKSHPPSIAATAAAGTAVSLSKATKTNNAPTFPDLASTATPPPSTDDDSTYLY